MLFAEANNAAKILLIGFLLLSCNSKSDVVRLKVQSSGKTKDDDVDDETLKISTASKTNRSNALLYKVRCFDRRCTIREEDISKSVAHLENGEHNLGKVSRRINGGDTVAK